MVARFIPVDMKVSGMSGIGRKIPNMASASRMVSGIGGGSGRLIPATPPAISAVWAVRAAPAIAAPATVVACPSASAFNLRFHHSTSRPGRGGERKESNVSVCNQSHAW